MKTHLIELFHHKKSWHLPALLLFLSSVQSLSRVRLFATAAHQASLSTTSSWSLRKLMAIESVKPSNHLILCHPFPPAFSLSQPSGSFPRSPFFASGGLSMVASASASILPVNIQDWFPLGLTGWISLQSKGLLRKRAILSYEESVPKDWFFFFFNNWAIGKHF